MRYLKVLLQIVGALLGIGIFVVLNPVKSYRAKSHKVVPVRLAHNSICRHSVMEKGRAS